ncbi:hypothetical protein A176_002717 [Myxococcus hansupus]|uniref:DUF2029 domain-containing protein n=1 Tax=Pseudomyxococcus hansupus TaxID=1297742 RepID=A0A0H4WWS4_9BACT|nr:glycosyltransferase family 87 protein [Myxococcus hansupus]AKQ65805.1 hypothetical protein A176_002717 [Myxococcus hansupus]
MSAASTSPFRASLNARSGFMAGFIAGVLAPLLAVLLSLTGAPLAVLLLAALGAWAGLFYVLVPKVPASWVAILQGWSRTAFTFWAVACVLVVVLMGRLGVFMADPNLKQYSLAPMVEFMVKHTCLSGYLSAAVLADLGTENLYILSHYKSPEMEAVLPAVAPLERDFYAYPPQFLLLPKLMLAMSGDFFALRTGWYVFYASAALMAMLAVAFWVGGREGAWLGVLTPVIWLSLPTLVNIQLGNIHLLIYALCLGAMICFERKREALGGALLAFAILSKLFPGLLGIYLLLQRRWKAAAWSAFFGLVYSGVAYAVLGPKPFVDYITYDVPRISSGELFDFVWNFVPAILVNYSPFGLPFKLQLVGVDIADPLVVARTVMTLYTLLLLALVVRVSLRLARRQASGAQGSRFRLSQVVVWIALLSLASFRSPFAPWTYCAVGGVWLMAAYAPLRSLGTRSRVAFIAGWVLISIYGPPVVGPMVAFTLVAQTILYVSGFWIALKASAPDVEEEKAPVPLAA